MCIAELSRQEELYVSSSLLAALAQATWFYLAQLLILLRTKIYNYLSAAYLFAGVGGAAIGSALLSNHVYLLNALSIAFFVLTIFIAMLIPLRCGRKLSAKNCESHSLPLDAPDSPSAPLVPYPSSTLSGHSVPLSGTDSQVSAR